MTTTKTTAVTTARIVDWQAILLGTLLLAFMTWALALVSADMHQAAADDRAQAQFRTTLEDSGFEVLDTTYSPQMGARGWTVTDDGRVLSALTIDEHPVIFDGTTTVTLEQYLSAR